MKNKKVNNLLVAGKKAALIGMLATLPLSAKAYDERAYMTPGEQYEYQTYGTLPDDLEGKYDNNSKGWAVAGEVLLTLGVILGGIYLFGVKKGADIAGKLDYDKKQELLKKQQENQK